MLFADKNSYDNCQKNINIFKNYFLNIWVPTHLSVEEEQVFNNIPADITEINKHLINSINVIGTENKKRLMSREVDLDIIERNAEDVNIDRDIYTMVSPNDPRFVKANKISDIFNQPSNYSYGDLLLMIDKYETYFESEENRRFTNAIKIYYSILLFETMFFKSNEVVYNLDKWKQNEKKKIIEEIKEEEKKVKVVNVIEKIDEAWSDFCKKTIPIQRLIGGTVYYPNYFEIIPSEYFKQKGPSFDAKRAFYHKLPAEDKELVGKTYPLFSVLYYGDIRPDRYDTKHIYDTRYDNNAEVDGTRFVTFDILSILSNMLNPWHTISRLDDDDRYSLWKKGLENWGNYCTIIGDSIATPNSILPFYSVDVMLSILKKQISDVEVDETGRGRIGVYKEYKRIIDKIRDELYNRNKIDEIIIKGKMEIGVDYDEKADNHTHKVKAVITRIKRENNSEKKDLYTNIARAEKYNMDIPVGGIRKEGKESEING